MRHEDAFGEVGSDHAVECPSPSSAEETARHSGADRFAESRPACTWWLVGWWRTLRRTEPQVADHRIAGFALGELRMKFMTFVLLPCRHREGISQIGQAPHPHRRLLRRDGGHGDEAEGAPEPARQRRAYAGGVRRSEAAHPRGLAVADAVTADAHAAYDAARHGAARYDAARHGAARHGAAQHGARDMVRSSGTTKGACVKLVADVHAQRRQ